MLYGAKSNDRSGKATAKRNRTSPKKIKSLTEAYSNTVKELELRREWQRQPSQVFTVFSQNNLSD